MNQRQKLAWFNVVVLGTSILVCLAVMTWAWPTAGVRALNALGLLGVGLLVSFLGPLLIRKDPESQRIPLDERDAEIVRRAEAAGNAAVWSVLAVAFLVSWAVRGLNGSVGVPSLGITFAVAYVVSQVAESVTMLMLYREGAGDDEG